MIMQETSLGAEDGCSPRDMPNLMPGNGFVQLAQQRFRVETSDNSVKDGGRFATLFLRSCMSELRVYTSM